MRRGTSRALRPLQVQPPRRRSTPHPLRRPTGLTANAVSPSQVNLSWSASTDNDAVAYYRVYRNGAFVANVTTTTYQELSLSPSTTYSYNVDARDGTGNVSGLSAAAVVTTLSAPDTTAPTTPTGLAASTVSATRINLNLVGVYGQRRSHWLPRLPERFAPYYRGQRHHVPEHRFESGYHVIRYSVRALDAAGNVSAQSNTASATTQALPIPPLRRRRRVLLLGHLLVQDRSSAGCRLWTTLPLRATAFTETELPGDIGHRDDI